MKLERKRPLYPTIRYYFVYPYLINRATGGLLVELVGSTVVTLLRQENFINRIFNLRFMYASRISHNWGIAYLGMVQVASGRP